MLSFVLGANSPTCVQVLFYVTCQRKDEVNARIRARATHHDLSTAIPHKKKEMEQRRKREREKRREMMFENSENECENDPSAVPLFFSYRYCFWINFVSIVAELVLDAQPWPLPQAVRRRGSLAQFPGTTRGSTPASSADVQSLM